MVRLHSLLRVMWSGFIIVALLLVVHPVNATPWSQRSTFVSSKFESIWRRSDDPTVRSGRSLYWGFEPWFDYNEFYRESGDGLRQVQYFDKARMEINGITNQDVTNGLLVVELVSGQLKLGENGFDNAQRDPANRVPVAGDSYGSNSQSPTYASFGSVATVNNGYRDPDRRDSSVGDVIDKGGNRSSNQTLLNTYRDQTKLVVYNTVTGHNIPHVFWTFLNLNGAILVDVQRTTGPIVDWVSAMGYPVTDPYWVRAKVGGTEKDVLVQLFERRILTYTPTNDPAYQVEMGNVGQHYFQWRYPHLGTPWNSADPEMPIAFASSRGTTSEFHLYTMKSDGTQQKQFGTDSSKETVPFSWLRSWDATKTQLLVDSRRGDGTHRQIWTVNADGSMKRLTYSDGTPVPPGVPYQGYTDKPANDWNPSVSPDGTKLLFASDRIGAYAQIYISSIDGGSPLQLTNDSCIHNTPTWGSNGRQIFWEADCGGKFNIYRADLKYSDDTPASYGTSITASVGNIVNLTNSTTSDNRFPRVAPNGNKIIFTTNRDGNYEIYMMNIDGSSATRLTTSSGDDMAPSWNMAGTKLTFDSNRDGNWNVYVMNLDGSGQTQLTTDSKDDRWNVWGQ